MAPSSIRSILAMEPFRPLVLSLMGRSECVIRRREDATLLGDGSAVEVFSDGRRCIISTRAIVSITIDDSESVPVIVETKTE